jgi:hypothetical protein
MKRMIKYFFVICFIMSVLACEKEAEEPEIISFEAVPSTITVGEAVTFRFQVKADYVTLWTGNQETSSINRDYNGYLEQINNPPDDEEAVNRFYNKGIALAVTDSVYVYALYKDPGLFDAVLIVTNAGKLGDEYKRKQASIQVEVLEAP